MLKQHATIAIFKHTYRPLYIENKRGGHLQNCRLRLKKANKAAKASKNRKRFRKSIIIRSAFSSWFHLHISMVPANNKTLVNIFQMGKPQLQHRKFKYPFDGVKLFLTGKHMKQFTLATTVSTSCLHPSYKINYIYIRQDFQVN